jgi:hypothetical protein
VVIVVVVVEVVVMVVVVVVEVVVTALVIVCVDELLSVLLETVELLFDVNVGTGLSVDVFESAFFKVVISLVKVLFDGSLTFVAEVNAPAEVCTSLRDWLADCFGVVIGSFSVLDLPSEFDEVP